MSYKINTEVECFQAVVEGIGEGRFVCGRCSIGTFFFSELYRNVPSSSYVPVDVDSQTSGKYYKKV